MANPEHVKILEQGAGAVAEWRRGHPLGGLDLRGTDLSEEHTNRRGSKLFCADLGHADLTRANLSGANLILTRLGNSILDGANLSNAILAYADFSGSSVRGASFAGAHVQHAVFGAMDLSQARGLDTIRHAAPSSIGIDTLLKSRGRIPEVFLRGCGVPQTLISYLPSLLGDTPDFHTCFISYCEEDDDFSERLYNDLQARGVRCWRWREDSRWGNDLLCDIDRTVSIYDKLVLICSKDSLDSEPVQDEIIRAIQREQKEKKNVLFPITIDDRVYTWDHGYAANVTRKHVGDFREWKDPNAYKKALDRLIRDLRQDPAA